MSDYYQKYIKYKNKYLNLKNHNNQTNTLLQSGGKLGAYIIKDINLFTDPYMEQFLNPIYGLIMTQTNYIRNILTIKNIVTIKEIKEIMGITGSNEIDEIENEIKLVNNIVATTNNTYRPSDVLFIKLLPSAIGKYMALLYFCTNEDNNALISKLIEPKNSSTSHYTFFTPIIHAMNVTHQFSTRKSTVKINTNLPLGTTNKNMFHMLLYCLWWISNDKSKIQDYYEGINWTFSYIQSNRIGSLHSNYTPLTIPEFTKYTYNEVYSTNPTNPTNPLDNFTQITNFNISLCKIILSGGFIEIPYQQAKAPCNDTNNPFNDCTETAMRNFINILIFEQDNLNIDRLRNLGDYLGKKLKANDFLLEYYETYDTFTKQLTQEARNNWITLLSSHFSNKVEHRLECEMNDMEYPYEIKATYKNFIQLLKNFFNINDESIDIFVLLQQNNDLIKEISIRQDNYKTYITIVHKFSGTYIITIDDNNHASLGIVNVSSTQLSITDLTLDQRKVINILLGTDAIFIDKFLHQKITITYINNILTSEYPYAIKILILIIGLNTFESIRISERIANSLYDNNFFRLNKSYFSKLIIDLSTLDFIIKQNMLFSVAPSVQYIQLKTNLKSPIRFTEGIDVSTVKAIYNNFLTNSRITSITLSNLPELKTIGDNFLQHSAIRKITLSNLPELETIGDNFLYRCEEINEINTLDLPGLKTIGNNFMSNCDKISTLDLTPLISLKVIGNNFLDSCIKIEIIDLSKSNLLISIGNNFLANCSKVNNLNLKSLIALETIGSSFIYNCKNITELDLTPLVSLRVIKHSFLSYCGKITTIDLSHSINLQHIKGNFLYKCINLKTINLLNLRNLMEIGHDFLYNCHNIEELDLTSLINLETIRNNFLYGCTKIKSVILPNNIKIKSIGDNFMKDCICVTDLDLTSLSDLKTIGNNFMEDCSELVNITLPVSIEEFGSEFLYNCMKVEELDLASLSKLKTIGNNFGLSIKKIIFPIHQRYKKMD